MLQYQFVESVSKKTLLGIRFWDPALDAQIQDGLRVTLTPIENLRQVNTAFRTKSGVYAFNNVPGMHLYEAFASEAEEVSPPETKRFILDVVDSRRQFSAVSLLVDLPLPYDGLFLVDDNAGSPSTAPKGFNLYSSINRTASAQHTFVRGELIDRISDEPAAHALVRVQTEDEFSWYGLADAEGKFAIMMPYPLISSSFGSSPPTTDGTRLFQRTWDIDVAVMYEPLNQDLIDGALQPDYSSILSQSQGLIYTETPNNDDGEVSEIQAELVYGRDLILKTSDLSELYVQAS